MCALTCTSCSCLEMQYSENLRAAMRPVCEVARHGLSPNGCEVTDMQNDMHNHAQITSDIISCKNTMTEQSSR